MTNLKKTLVATVALSIAVLNSVHALAEEHTRVTNPTNLGFEALGRGMVGSVQLDRMFTDDIAGGLGFGMLGLNTVGGASTGNSGYTLPVFLNYYFSRKATSIFATGGGTLVWANGSVTGLQSSLGGVEFTSTPVVFNLGVGVEVRTDAGWLLRATAYGLYSRTISPWAGITFGYSF